METLNIFEYASYRKYLRDLYAQKKATAKGFSHRVFVRICGFASPNFLKLVMDGKRNLGKRAQDKLIGALCRNKVEKEYMRAIILFEQAKTNEDKDLHLATISRLKHKTKVKVIEVEQYEYLSSWCNVAIMELVNMDDFSEDHAWINKKLGTKFTANAVRKIIEKLLSLKLLERGEDGRLKQRDERLVCDPAIFSLAVINYHKQMIQKGIESIESSRSADRDITGLTVGLDRKAFQSIRESIKRCREEIHQLASSAEKHDVVCQINFQLFNLSEATWKQKDS